MGKERRDEEEGCHFVVSLACGESRAKSVNLRLSKLSFMIKEADREDGQTGRGGNCIHLVKARMGLGPLRKSEKNFSLACSSGQFEKDFKVSRS